jgi:hypothetical protein
MRLRTGSRVMVEVDVGYLIGIDVGLVDCFLD